MANSKLATYNANCQKRNPRKMKIDRITPHYMAGNMGARQCADYFCSTDRQASCNYTIGSDGAIAVCVPEDFRAWTSSSEANDTRSVTAELANIDASGRMTPEGYAAAVTLFADICTRNNIDPHYDGTPNGSITMHKQFAATSCPGDWLTQKIVSGEFEKDIKAKMNKPETKPKPDMPFFTEEPVGSVYRFYSDKEHFWTTSYKEAEKLFNAGWTYEGVAWNAPAKGDPVYRLYNPNSGKHHFTADAVEKDRLVELGWKDEGVAFYSAGSVPIYRMYNPNNGAHILTASRKEHDALTKAGWFCEGQPLASEAAE